MTQPRIYSALSFEAPSPDGRISYVQHLVAATSFEQAEQALREAGDIGRETYLLTAEAVERGPVTRTVNGQERFDRPTIEEHWRWVDVMTKAQWNDGRRDGPTYKRIYA